MIKSLLQRLAQLGALLLVVLSIAAYFPHTHWLVDMTAHFRIQYLIGALLLLPIAVITHARTTIGGLLVPIAINLLAIAPWYLAAPPVSAAADTEAIRILTANVHRDNTDTARVIDTLTSAEADILGIIELTPNMARALSAFDATHPHQFLFPQTNHFGVGLLSRHPILESEALFIGQDQFATVRALVDIDGTATHVFVTHPIPPFGRQGTLFRDQQINALIDTLQTVDTPLIVMGDFNATPWSAPMRDLFDQTALRDSGLGHRLPPTWMTRNYPFGVPIDYVLVSAEFHARNRTVGQDVGSDHFPVIADLTIKP